MQGHPFKLLHSYSILLNSRDSESPSSVQHSASTNLSEEQIVLYFGNNFQYGRLWDFVLLGMVCSGIPLSNKAILSRLFMETLMHSLLWLINITTSQGIYT